MLSDDNSQGFTLIELLLVVLIIGIIAGTAIITYSPPPFSEERDKLNTLLDQINRVQEKALLESIPFGILFFREKYIFLEIRDNTWIESSAYPSAKFDFSDALLNVDQMNANIPSIDFVDKIFPQIVFSPSAEMSPFVLTVNLQNEDFTDSISFEISSDILGRAKLKQVRN